jgi:hypothetical protein
MGADAELKRLLDRVSEIIETDEYISIEDKFGAILSCATSANTIIMEDSGQ